MKELMNIPINDFNNVLPLIDDKSIDLIFADLPFNTTNCKWDRPIPLNWNVNGLEEKDFLIEQMMHGIPYKEVLENWKIRRKMGLWQHYNRIIKDDGVILLYAQTPFDKELGMSNKKNLRYEWIWEKTQATGHLNANKMPMKAHENILVFYKNKPPKAKDFKRTYNYIKTTGHSPVNSYTKSMKNGTADGEIYGKTKSVSGGGSTERFPRSVLKFKSDKQLSKLHSTQKPLALTEYMIETYSNEGDIVLDNCAGSYVVAEASNKLKRNWICIEKDEKIHNKSIKERKL
jgi:site-specific DNA-methyltransferase (adenine-specific)